MAYVITVRGSVYLGPGVMLQFGDYSCTNADTTTVEIPLRYPIAALFMNSNKGETPGQTLSAKAASSTGNSTTFTLTSGATETDGRFMWITTGY